MDIDYAHDKNSHTLESPRLALPAIFGDTVPLSVLDVGCGTGTWLKACIELGISDVFGVDGVNIATEKLLFPCARFQCLDLSKSWSLHRTFDIALCLEVAEHLHETSGNFLVECLTAHSETIVFSAACPGQIGQHHVNCQWPDYWQSLFNEQGYSCNDVIRWRIWDEVGIEPWYRQNMFVATRSSLTAIHDEGRIKPVIHPDMLQNLFLYRMFTLGSIMQLDKGEESPKWYFNKLILSLMKRIFNE